jgi:hypothetical protein
MKGGILGGEPEAIRMFFSTCVDAQQELPGIYAPYSDYRIAVKHSNLTAIGR